MTTPVRTISVALSAKIAEYVSNMRQAGQATHSFAGELVELGSKNKQQFDTIIKAGAALSIGLVGAFTAAVGSAAAFDKQMSEVAAVSGATGDQLNALRTAAINAGQATVFSASQAAEAEAELAKAGLSTGDILGGGLTGAMSLAAAGSLSLSDAATDAATALNEFQLSGSQTGHVADLLAAGANKSATDVSGLAQSLNQSGLVAHQTGLTLEQTVGTLSAFAQAGLHGSDAGTSFKTMLQALQSPSKITKALMDQLGISAYDAQGKFIGITALAQQLQNQLKGLTQAQRDAALAQIFGTDAVRAADILYQQGAAGLQGWIDKVNQTGAAADTAQQKMNNLSGDLENLKGSIETVTIAAGEGAQSGLRQLAQAATRLVNGFSVMPATLATVGTDVTGFLGLFVGGATAFAKAKEKSDELQKSLQNMGPAGVKAAAGLQFVTEAGGRLAVILGSLQAASAAFGSTIDPQSSQVVDDLIKFGQTGKATGVELQHLSYDLGTTGTGAMAKFGNGVAGTVESLTGLGNVFDESMVHAKERLTAIDQGLAALVNSADPAKITSAQQAFQQLFNIAQQQGVSLADLNKALPNYTAAWAAYNDQQQQGVIGADGLVHATDDLSDSQANAAATAASQAVQQQLVVSSIQDTIGDVKGLVNLLDQLNGANISQIQAENDLQAAYDDATAAIKANGKTAIQNHSVLDAGTAKGRANRDALIAIAQAADQASQAILNQTGDVSKANKVLTDARDVLIADAEKMGLTKQAAQALANQILNIPPTSSTTFSAPGLVQANDTASGYARLLNSLDGTSVSTTFTTRFQTKGTPPPNYYHGNRYGGLYTHAAEGLLSEASLYTPADPGRFMIAEPGTGGEAFVPKHGNYARSMQILDHAARWYNARVVPNAGYVMAGGGGDAPTSTSVTYNVYPQQANFTVQDLAALSARHDAQMRVGRRR